MRPERADLRIHALEHSWLSTPPLPQSLPTPTTRELRRNRDEAITSGAHMQASARAAARASTPPHPSPLLCPSRCPRACLVATRPPPLRSPTPPAGNHTAAHAGRKQGRRRARRRHRSQHTREDGPRRLRVRALGSVGVRCVPSSGSSRCVPLGHCVGVPLVRVASLEVPMVPCELGASGVRDGCERAAVEAERTMLPRVGGCEPVSARAWARHAAVCKAFQPGS